MAKPRVERRLSIDIAMPVLGAPSLQETSATVLPDVFLTRTPP